ncbi:MAG: redoxin domain-containing protein [Bacteroidetes bacterium]|nr:redoxin domain-containing protein [Bacteroidota bacterium]MBS1931584.1 redoxin domain-containing protein [Bacteroidota bacterium]
MLYKKQIAPGIAADSISGSPINTNELKGKKILIKFHRFSGCPIAQRQIHEFIERQKELNTAGVETIIFMHTGKDKIVPVYREVQGLHIIPDKQKKFYHLFGSEFLFLKFFSLFSWTSTFKSFFKGYFPLVHRFGGGISGVPSDFLLNEEGEIVDLHYGKHFGDSWSVSEVLKKLD